MREIKESDWKVLRRVHPLALERFCGRVLAEIGRVSRDGAKGHHARYLQVFGIIQQRDREMARLFDNPRRSHALTMLAQIRSQGLLTEDEFSSLSPERAVPFRCCSVRDEPPIWLHGLAFPPPRSSIPNTSSHGCPQKALAYSPTKPPARDYFFQYTWILPGIFDPQVNLREHRYFGSSLKDSARFLFDFYLSAGRFRSSATVGTAHRPKGACA
jgi:hypothetical protein